MKISNGTLLSNDILYYSCSSNQILYNCLHDVERISYMCLFILYNLSVCAFPFVACSAMPTFLSWNRYEILRTTRPIAGDEADGTAD